jgi:hypothetical protein
MATVYAKHKQNEALLGFCRHLLSSVVSLVITPMQGKTGLVTQYYGIIHFFYYALSKGNYLLLRNFSPDKV